MKQGYACWYQYIPCLLYTSVQGDTGHAEAEMVTDVYSEIIDEDRRYNAQKMDEQFYSCLLYTSRKPTIHGIPARKPLKQGQRKSVNTLPKNYRI